MPEVIGNRYLAHIDATRRLEKHYDALFRIKSRRPSAHLALGSARSGSPALVDSQISLNNQKLRNALNSIERGGGRYNQQRVGRPAARVTSSSFRRRQQRAVESENFRLAASLSQVKSRFSASAWRQHAERTDELIRALQQNGRRLLPFA